MADPQSYQVTYSFSGYQSLNPAKPLPASEVDAQFAAIQQAMGEAVSAITDIRRSDGALKNGVVGFNALDNDLKAGYSGGAVSAWAPVVNFAAGITAQAVAPATVVVYSGETYVCIVPHVTTSVFVPSNWRKIAARGVNGSGSGDMLAANNLSDLQSISQALSNLGLNNVNNTADSAKPVSAAMQVALDAISLQLTDPWYFFPIGVPIPIMTHRGAVAPPTDRSYRYVVLTASAFYNTGVLTSETVSGSAPLVSATAVVSLGGSPLNGQTIRLLNTEGRFLRPSASSGTLQDDALQNFTGSVGTIVSGTNSTATNGVLRQSGGSDANLTVAGGQRYYQTVDIDVSRQARTANETRVKNEGAFYYMRIK